MELCSGKYLFELLNFLPNFVPFQCIFGVFHDDYNYQEIDQVLDQNLKEFINACCNQQSNCSKSIHLLGSKLNFTDKIHISILVMEARLQSEILFALKAVMKHMSWKLVKLWLFLFIQHKSFLLQLYCILLPLSIILLWYFW